LSPNTFGCNCIHVKNLTLLFAGVLLFSSAFGQKKEYKTENVFIITFDGLRWQELYTGADEKLIGDKDFVKDPEALKKEFWADDAKTRREKLFPFFWSEIASKGQLYGNRELGSKVNCSNDMWFSYPGYNEILSGFADDKRIKSNDKIPNPNKTVLEFVNNQPAFKGKVAGFGSWDVFPFIINSERSGIPVNAGFMKAEGNNLTDREKLLNELQDEIPGPWGGVRLDAFTHHFMMEYVKKNSPRLVYISYGETDDWAHDGDYDAYLLSARRTDQFIKELWAFIQSSPKYKDKTTLLITTDHGRGTVPKESWKSHGKQVDGAGQIWMMAIGPDTPALGEVKTEGQLYQNQVAATAATLLGLKYVNTPEPGAVVGSMITK
jgi:hypothetical protein